MPLLPTSRHVDKCIFVCSRVLRVEMCPRLPQQNTSACRHVCVSDSGPSHAFCMCCCIYAHLHLSDPVLHGTMELDCQTLGPNTPVSFSHKYTAGTIRLGSGGQGIMISSNHRIWSMSGLSARVLTCVCSEGS
jgi:hypothetical protein